MSGFSRCALWMGLALAGTLGISSTSHAAVLSQIDWDVTGGDLSSSDGLNGEIFGGHARFTADTPAATPTGGLQGVLRLSLSSVSGQQFLLSVAARGSFNPNSARVDVDLSVSTPRTVTTGAYSNIRPSGLGGASYRLPIDFRQTGYAGPSGSGGVEGEFTISTSGAQAFGTTAPRFCPGGGGTCTFAHTYTLGNEVRTTVTTTTTTTTFPTTTSTTTTTTTTSIPPETTTTTTTSTAPPTTTTTSTTTTTTSTTTTTTSTTTTTTTVPSPPKVTVCHKGKPLRVSRAALDGHLQHGDALGACL